MATTKKSDSWSATLSLSSGEHNQAMAAALSCEEGEAELAEQLLLKIEGERATDVRARLNSAFRSLIAADEALMSLAEQRQSES